MESKKTSRRHVLAEAMEPRLLFAYPAMTQLTGSSNPMNGVNIGAFSNPSFGDVDGDGDIDVVVGQGEFVRYFRNTGTATAPIYTQIIGSQNPFAGLAIGNAVSNPVLADMDADGDADLVLGSNAGIRYFENNSSASSIVPIYFEETGAANPFTMFVDAKSAPAIADLDGDGDLDLILGELGGLLFFHRNIGNANLASFANTGADNPLLDVDLGLHSTPALADMDNDGDLDVFAGSLSGQIRYFTNIGNARTPTYAEQTGPANPMNGFSITGVAPSLADLDADGDVDLLAGSESGTLTVYRSNAVAPPVNFQSSTPNPFAAFNVGGFSNPSLGDVDGDGDLDAVVGQEQFVRYFRNNGTSVAPNYAQVIGVLNPFRDLVLGNTRTNPVLADMDSDGDLDLVAGSGVGIRYFRNNSAAVAPVPSYAELSGASNPFNSVVVDGNSAPALADIDADGDLDIILGDLGGLLRYFRNLGNANSPSFDLSGAGNPMSGTDVGDNSTPAVADFDNDGDLDVIIGSLAGTVRYYMNAGTAGNPILAQQIGTANPFDGVSIPAASPTAADVDGDGESDVLFGSQSGPFSYFRANRAPVLANAIADQAFTGTGIKSYTVSADTFLELEGNAITYTAARTNGTALPAWLSFNATTRQFSGNPSWQDITPLQIRVTANDGQGGSAFDDFQLTLSNVGDAPVANNDSYSVNQDTVLIANGNAPNPNGVTANDTNPDGLPLSTLVVNQSSHGTVTMTPAGNFSYTPTAGYNGPDSFTYRSSDGLFQSNVATVSLTVIDNVRPTVQTPAFSFENAPHAITAQFSENVSASLSTADFAVTSAPSNTPVPYTFGYDTATNTASLSFFSTLPDGDYSVRVVAAGIADPAGNTMLSNQDLGFFFISGDANRDRSVDIGDFAVVASRFNAPGTFSQGDFNYNGSTEIGDFAILASKFNTALPAARHAGMNTLLWHSSYSTPASGFGPMVHIAEFLSEPVDRSVTWRSVFRL